MGRPHRLQRRRHHRQGAGSEGPRGEPRRAHVAAGGGENRGNGRRRHQHGDAARACDFRRRRAQRGRRRERNGHQARTRAGAQGLRDGASRPVASRQDAQGEGAGRRHLRTQRCDDRRSRGRGDGQGRRRRRHHGRGIQDDGDHARSRRGHAVRPRLHIALFHQRPRKNAVLPGRSLAAGHRPQDRSDQRSAAGARPGGEVRATSRRRRRGRRGRGAGDAHRQSRSRSAENLRGQGARLRRPAQGDVAGHRGADRRPSSCPRSLVSSSRARR